MIKNKDNNKSKKELSLFMFTREVNNRLRYIGINTTTNSAIAIEKSYKKGLSISDVVSSIILKYGPR